MQNYLQLHQWIYSLFSAMSYFHNSCCSQSKILQIVEHFAVVITLRGLLAFNFAIKLREDKAFGNCFNTIRFSLKNAALSFCWNRNPEVYNRRKRPVRLFFYIFVYLLKTLLR